VRERLLLCGLAAVVRVNPEMIVFFSVREEVLCLCVERDEEAEEVSDLEGRRRGVSCVLCGACLAKCYTSHLL